MKRIVLVNLNKSNNVSLIDQFFYFIHLILKMMDEKKNIMIIDYNYDEENKDLFLLNIINWNNHFFKEMNIHIILKSEINFNLLSVKYGNINKNNIDLTDYTYIHFYKKNILFIPKTVFLNKIKGDPIQYEEKKIIVNYSLNNILCEDIYNELNGSLCEIILYDFYDYKNYLHFDGNLLTNNYIPFFLFENIKFKFTYYIYTQYFFNKYFNNSDIINIIYINIDDTPSSDNISILEKKYINEIENNIYKEDKNLIITNKVDNSIIHYLKENNYPIYFMEKEYFQKEEIYLIHTFLLTRFCNNIFIGYYEENNEKKFDYYIRQLLDETILQILISSYE